MKKVLFFFLFTALFFYSELRAGVNHDNPEYVIFRVEYNLKKAGFEMKLFIDTGSSKNHSLKNIAQNVEGDGVRVTKKDGSIEVVHSEVDLLNCLSEYGWKLKETYTIKIMSNEYQTYIMIKE